MDPETDIEAPNISSVIKYPITSLFHIGVSAGIFWLNEHDISRYLAFAIISINTITKMLAFAPINVKAMYSPADAWRPKLVTAAWNAVIPTFFAWIPNVKDTAKYPNAIGIPPFNPLQKLLLWFSIIFT